MGIRINRLGPADKGSLKFTHISGAGVYSIVSGAAAYLSTITVNTKGGTGSVLEVYNNSVSGGDVIAVIDTATAITGDYHYRVECISGLTVGHYGGTPADITVASTKNQVIGTELFTRPLP